MFDVKLDLEAAGGAAGGMSAGSDGLHKCKSCQQSQPIGIFNGLKTCPPCLRQSKRKRDQAREDKAEVERRKEELNARVESVRRSHQSLLGENARLHERRGMTPSDQAKEEDIPVGTRCGSISSGGSRETQESAPSSSGNSSTMVGSKRTADWVTSSTSCRQLLASDSSVQWESAEGLNPAEAPPTAGSIEASLHIGDIGEQKGAVFEHLHNTAADHMPVELRRCSSCRVEHPVIHFDANKATCLPCLQKKKQKRDHARLAGLKANEVGSHLMAELDLMQAKNDALEVENQSLRATHRYRLLTLAALFGVKRCVLSIV